MTGKTLNIKMFVTGKNLEKLDQIRQYLNSQNDVKIGEVDRWTKSEVYQLLFNDAIENFQFLRQVLSCLFPVRWCFLSGSFSAARFPKCLFSL